MADHDSVDVSVSQLASRVADGKYRVYCAGKIAKKDWRHEVFVGIEHVSGPEKWEDQGHGQIAFDLDGRVIRGPFEYGGPFFISGVSGKSHGDGSHGAAANCTVHEWNFDPSPWSITDHCLRWIDVCDVMFVWLDDPTAYGTVTEIGYARARDIPIFLYEPKRKTLTQERDMWFPRTICENPRSQADDPVSAFDLFTETWLNYCTLRSGGSVAREGYIYLIRADTGEYKIGRAKNVDQRIISFGGAKHPFRWEVIHTIEVADTCAAERHLHRLYERRRVNGEWFVLNNEDVEFIKSIQRMGAA